MNRRFFAPANKRRIPGSLNRAGALLVLGLLLLTSAIGVFGALRPTSTLAASSSTLTFQARLLNTSGSLVADGTYNVEFKIYDTVASGASAQGICSLDSSIDDCWWVETRTGGSKVTVKNGYVYANLGSVTAFSSTIPWDQELWITMNIGGTGSPSWDGEMSPRFKVAAVPYAFAAQKLQVTDSAITNKLVFATPSASSKTITLPNETGTVCTTGSVCSGYQASGSYLTTESDTLATVTGRGATTSTASSFTGGLTVSGASSSINASSNFATNINTGTSSGAITLGGGSSLLSIDSTNFDVSTAGALSGITTISTSSTINSQTISSTANFTGTVTVQGAGTALTLSGAATTALSVSNTGVTTDISLQNGETIDNNTNGTIRLTSTITSVSGSLGVGTATTPAQLSVMAPAGSSVREKFAEFSVSDDAGSLFAIGNGTYVDGNYIPSLVGYNSTSSTRNAMIFNGAITSSVDSGSTSVMSFISRTVSGDYLNGTYGTVSARPLFTWQNNNTEIMALSASGGLTLSGAATTSINISNVGVTTDISLQNSETIDNNVDGRIKFTGDTLTSGNAYFANGTTYYINSTGVGNLNTLTVAGAGAALVVTNNTTIGGTLGVGGASVTVGTASTTDGTIVLQNSTNAFTATITGLNTSGSSKTITLPNETGTVCTTGSVCSGYQASVTGGAANQQLSNLSGTVAINTALLPGADNTIDLGSAAASFGTLYSDTSVLTPLVDVASAGTLSLGTSTATAVSLGRSGITTTNNGALTSSQLFTGVLGATISGATTSINASSNFATNINTGTSTGAISLGNSAAGVITVQSASTIGLTGTTSITGLSTGDALTVSNSTSTGNILVVNDNATAVLTVADGGAATFRNQTDSTAAFQIQNSTSVPLVTVDTTNKKLIVATDTIATGASTATTATTSGTGTNTTTLVFSGTTSFANNDILFIDNAGQDYYTRIVSGDTAASVTVSPAVTFETGRTVTKYTVQSIGATSSDYATLNNRFFQGYFLGGVVAGAGSTTLSDQSIMSTGALYVKTNGENTRLTIDTSGNSTFSGTLTVSGDSAIIGVNDTGAGGKALSIYGGGAGTSEGGQIELFTSADYDTTVNSYTIDAYQDSFRIFNGTGTAFILGAGTGTDIQFTQSDDADATDTNNALDISVTSSSGDADTVRGINIGNLTAGTATEVGLRVGTGWDTDILLSDTTPSIAIGNTGTLTVSDSAGNSLLAVADSGTAGILNVSGSAVFGGAAAGSDTVEVQGTGAGYSLYDRSTGATDRWSIYASGGILKLWENGTGDRFTINQSGNTTISGTLAVTGDVSLGGKHAFRSNDTFLRFNQDGAFTSGIHTPGFFNSNSLTVGAIYSSPGVGVLQTSANVFVGYNLGISTTPGGVGGSSVCRGTYGAYYYLGTCVSLARYKDEVQNIPMGLETIRQLRPVQYKWNIDTLDYDIGFIAEEIIAVNPMFGEYKDGIGSELTGVNYAHLVALAVKGIQINDARITVLESGEFAGDLHISGDAQFDGNLTVTGNTEVDNITVNGKIISAGDTPTVVLGATTTGDGSSYTIEGNDTAGSITITTGTATIPNPLAAGEQAVMTFVVPFTTTPRITLTPTTEAAANISYYITKAGTEFKIHFTSAPSPNTIYTFDYHAIQ